MERNSKDECPRTGMNILVANSGTHNFEILEVPPILSSKVHILEMGTRGLPFRDKYKTYSSHLHGDGMLGPCNFSEELCDDKLSGRLGISLEFWNLNVGYFVKVQYMQFTKTLY
jgi:hypothetical protein